MLWWFRMLNISARKSKDMRSVSANDLPNAKSAFHAPGPRKAFLAVMFAGNGPKVSMHPSHAGLHVESAPGSVSRLNSFGFNLLTLPGADSTCNPAWLGCIETFGPFPANMTARNAFRGPGAWNADFALGKSFQLTERMSLDFRAEMFNIFNHHNMYVNGYVNDAAGSGSSFTVVGKKGGLGSLAGSSIVTGNPSDERRFGQFALRLNF